MPAECHTITREIAVSAQKPPPLHSAAGSLWPLRNTWSRATEDLYSAWIAKLFDAPLDAELSWPALHLVLRDRSRNLLFNYLGLGEDEMGLVLRPDCAKLPYLLRAYFAFKMGLPFGYSSCGRGGHGSPPKCYQWFNIQNHEEPRPSPMQEQSTAPATAISTLGQMFSRPVAASAGAVFPRCALDARLRCLSADDGLPNPLAVELVMQRKSEGLSKAAEQLARLRARPHARPSRRGSSRCSRSGRA